MYNYKLKIMYDGSLYKGFAKQKDVMTIQGSIEEMLSLMFNEKIVIFGSGRTDKYVHALDQTINFKTKKLIDKESVKCFLNDKLSGIYVKNIEMVDSSFHSRFSIKHKSYVYVVNTGSFNIFREKYELQYNKKIDLEKANQAAKLFVGTHDFRSYSTCDLENTMRTVNNFFVYEINEKVFFKINGTGFLRNMVRMLVANIMAYCEGTKTLGELIDLLSNPKKGASCLKAKGCGLYLLETIY